MKAVIVPGKGKGYVIQDVPEPKIGKDEVLIKVNRAALCYRDLLQLQGYYPRMKYPVVLGHEVVGTIEQVGENVNGFKEGDKVISLLYAPDGTCKYCKMGEEAYCHSRLGYSEELDGFFAEKAKIKVNSLVKVGSSVSDEGAVLVPCVTGMVYRSLRRANLQKEETVLVTGASGGVGIHAIQVAKALGAKVIGVTTSEEKAKIISKFADHVIVGNKFSDEAKKIDDINVVIDTVGTPTIDESLKSLWMGGRLIQIGNVDPSQIYQLRLGYVILKDIKIIGHASATKRDAEETLKLTGEGKITPVIAGTVRLDEIDKGYEILKDKKKIGKVLLKP
ncbi:alcohol dehydrogenase [Sulfolobus sp. A20]|uniref:acryloyl-coenzyme A reductase n=1 Tax=Saccharolobus sp. A20 TaxID=1891280 RepID=UPI000845D7EE|nr:acryloyl-coenzyme A reductase [Sulfolobus sp. A20]TRM73702.1 alcohol dehydrogenase [Sulfolobus sp. E5]TRM73978.1 alcohol dehydrogenase [Sulfolobus sp. B5]TRM78286.1 alcohol dehydrogenase [Sulfolobus sp. A20-N-F8]TRN01162.1 alcohol dehydrogenase [Sulfolobus sp. F1]AOL15727.1 alcohol dehydrogenase [Sulfolobus sp. A20]